MTYEDFLTLTLPERIKWLHGEEGPHGKLSHDDFGKMLGGIKRGSIIGWEKAGGSEPRAVARKKLAQFSGYPEVAFSRRKAEAPQAATIRSRLEELADLAGRGFLALGVTQEQLLPPAEGRTHRANGQ